MKQSDEQPIVEGAEAKKGLPGESYTFDLVAHPYLLDQREKVEANPHQHVVYEGLHHLRKFLLGIDDYDLVRRVCRIEETDYEHKGIGELYHLPNVPQPYALLSGTAEEYQAFLSHVEQLMLIYISGRDRYSPLYPFYQENLSRRPYPILLYALALVPLGRHARYVGHAFLDHARQRDKDCPGLFYVHECYFMADHFYRGWEEKEDEKEKKE